MNNVNSSNPIVNNGTTFTITTSSSTSGMFYVNADTGFECADPIETMKSEFAILADKFLEKYRDEII